MAEVPKESGGRRVPETPMAGANADAEDRVALPAPRRRLSVKLMLNVTAIFVTVVGTLVLMLTRAAEERVADDRERRAAILSSALLRGIGRDLLLVDVAGIQYALDEARGFDPEVAGLEFADERRQVLASTDPARSLQSGFKGLLDAAERTRQPALATGPATLDGVYPLLTDGTLRGFLLVRHSLADTRREIRAVQGAGVVTLVVTLLAGAGLSLLIGRRLVAPIEALHRGARAILAGRLDTRLATDADDETALVSRAFNEVAGNLVEKIQALERSSADLARTNRELDIRVADLRSLQEAGKIFNSIFNIDELLRAIVQNATSVMKSRRCSIIVRDEATGDFSLRIAKGISGADEVVENVRLRSGGRITEHVLATREPLLVGDLNRDERFELPYDGVRYATSSFVAAPLLLSNRVLGVISLTDKHSGEPYCATDLNLLSIYANHLAFAIDNAGIYRRLVDRERIDAELSIAHEIQMKMLPRAYPSLAGISVAGVSEPALEMGGDYYDFLPVTGDRVALVIGDVSGKGVPAALLMVMIRSILRARVTPEVPPPVLIEELNRHLLTDTDDKMFVTLFYAEVDTAARTLRYVNAGHNETLLLRADGTTEVLAEGGLLMGMFERAKYVERTVPLSAGDRVIFYTDGITEAADASGVLYGVERLEAVARATAGLTAEGIRDAILADCRAYAGDGPASDDRTLIVLTVGEPPADGKGPA